MGYCPLLMLCGLGSQFYQTVNTGGFGVCFSKIFALDHLFLTQRQRGITAVSLLRRYKKYSPKRCKRRGITPEGIKLF